MQRLVHFYYFSIVKVIIAFLIFSHSHVENAQFSSASTGGQELARLYSKQPSLIPVDEFTHEDRERALELLLSQERVISLIYAKTFPVIQQGSSAFTLSNVGAANLSSLPHAHSSTTHHHRTAAELQTAVDLTFDHATNVEDLMASRPSTADVTNNAAAITTSAHSAKHGSGVINAAINTPVAPSGVSNASSSLKNISSTGSSSKLPQLNPPAASGGPPRKIISR